MTEKAKKINYTDADIEKLKAVYDPEATQEERDAQVERLAADLNKKKQSIIAKLVNLKVYVKKEYKAKDGKETMTKEKRVNEIAQSMGVVPELLDSLTKANVSVLKMIQDVVKERNETRTNLENVLELAHDAGVKFPAEDAEDSE